MTYAIIETGGKQYRVEEGRFYDVELLDKTPGEEFTIEQVLFVNSDASSGDAIAIGQPWVSGAAVHFTVLQHYKAKKVLVYKMKPKKKTRKKNGHRQPLTRILVNKIQVAEQISSEQVLSEQVTLEQVQA
jgi:large subunit ribosomal protein L21